MSYRSEVATQAPVAGWTYEESSGITVSPAYGAVSGTLLNGGFTLGDPSLVVGDPAGKSITSDGAGGGTINRPVINFGNNFNSVFGGSDKAWSLEVSAKAFTLPAGVVFAKFILPSGYGGSNVQFSLQGDNNGISGRYAFQVWFGSSTANHLLYKTALNLTTAELVHLVITYDGSLDTNGGLDRIKAYVNGVLDTPSSHVLTGALGDISDSATGPVQAFGATNGSLGLIPFKGQLQHQYVYDRVLSSTNVTDLYTAWNTAPPPLPAVNNVTADAAGTTLTVNYDVPGTEPILPATAATGFTVRRAGQRVKIGQVDRATNTSHTIPIVGERIYADDGSNWTVDYTPGNVADSDGSPNAMDGFSGEVIDITSVVGDRPSPGISLDEDGWSVVTPSVDSRIIYVANDGDDANDGMTDDLPKETIAAGHALLRSGSPDWLLMKRGDTFAGPLLNGVFGRSTTERTLYGTYGSGARPVINCGTSEGIDLGSKNHVALIGIDLYANGRDPDAAGDGTSTVQGISCNANAANHLIEDCRIRLFKDNIYYQANTAYGISNIEIRRCVVVDAWDGIYAHSQGIGIFGVDGVTLSENFIDHNGWHDTGTNGEATVFNHNVYMGSNNKNVTVSGNTFARGSATGIQMRSGGNCTNNLFIDNPLHLDYGYVNGASATLGGVSGEVSGNVFFGGGDINGAPRGFGIQVSNTAPAGGSQISGNIFTQDNQNQFPSIYLAYGAITGSGPTTGLIIHASDNTKVLPQLFYKPADVHVGNTIHITGGTGWTIGDYTIVSHDGTYWTLNSSPSAAGNTNNGSYNGGVGINDLTISGNKTYKWSSAIILGNSATPGTTGQYQLDGLVVENNEFQKNLQTVVVNHQVTFNGANELFSGNKYTTNAGSPPTFTVNSVSNTLAQWQALAEADAENNNVPYVDPDVTIGSYSTSVGGAGTTADFIANARLNRNGAWNDDYEAASVIAYFNAGFTLADPDDGDGGDPVIVVPDRIPRRVVVVDPRSIVPDSMEFTAVIAYVGGNTGVYTSVFSKDGLFTEFGGSTTHSVLDVLDIVRRDVSVQDFLTRVSASASGLSQLSDVDGVAWRFQVKSAGGSSLAAWSDVFEVTANFLSDEEIGYWDLLNSNSVELINRLG